MAICPARPGGRPGAVGRILGGLQNSNLEKRKRERERGMNNASLTRTWAHARRVRIASRIPPGLDAVIDDFRLNAALMLLLVWLITWLFGLSMAQIGIELGRCEG